MKTMLGKMAFIASCFMFGLSTLAAAKNVSQNAEYIVKYRNESALLNALSVDMMQIKDQHEAGQYYTVAISKKDEVKALVALISNPAVEYVVPNAEMRAFFVPMADSTTRAQWALDKIKADAAWKLAGNKGSRKVTVAVIDTGTDYKHKNLAPNMVTGYDFIKNTNDPMDITSGQNPGHGTHCAGIVGATGLIDGGVSGMSAEVSIMPLRFLDEKGSGDLNNGIKAIDYAIEKKVDVISASWGAAIPKKQAMPLIEAIARAEKAGIIFIVAAANDGKNNDSYEVYPANAGLSNTVSIAASNSSDGKPSWSNYGKAKVNIASPGDGIISTLPKDKYGNLSGTSMATPLVAGLVAFIKAQDPSLNPLEIRSLLQATGDKVSIPTACDCRINAESATQAVLSKKMFVSPFAMTLGKGEKQMFTAVYGQAPFKFTSSNAGVATISDGGELTAVSEGETTVSITDSKGTTATSYKIYVGKAPTSNPPNNPGQPPGDSPGQPPEAGECPFDPSICEMICQFQPDLPFCKK